MAEDHDRNDHRDDNDEPWDDDGYDDERDCFWCDGEGVSECSHPMECCNPHNSAGECRCSSCGGTGLAKDMTIW